MTLLTIATGLHGLPQWTRAEVEPLLIDNHDVLVEDLFVLFTNGFVLVGAIIEAAGSSSRRVRGCRPRAKNGWTAPTPATTKSE